MRLLADLRAFLGDRVAEWQTLRLEGLQYWHREIRLILLAAFGALLLLMIARLAQRRRPGREHILLPALPPSIVASRFSFVVHTPLLLFLAGLLLMAVAVADPHAPFITTDVSFPGRRIAIVVDASSSMRRGFITEEEDGRKGSQAAFYTTVEAAKRFVELRVKGKYRDLMSLIEFGNEAYVITPFTQDYDNILLSISLIGDPVEFDLFPDSGNTVISLAIQQSVELFKAFNFLEASGNLLVIFTDGEDTHVVVNGRSLDEIMASAVEARIPVYFVRTNWGRETGQVVTDNIWRAAVAKTGGRFYAVSDERTLAQAVNDIDTVGTGTISVRQYANQQPRFAMFAWAALACWMAATTLKLAVPYFQRVP